MNQIPTPNHLCYLLDPARRPLHVGTREARALVEHWGFTRNGEEYVKKLVRCGTLKARKFKHQRGNRFATEEVLALWSQETGA